MTCPVCGVRSPGRNTGIVFTIWSVVVFVAIAGGSLWLYFNERSAQLGVNLVIATATAATFRMILPMVVGPPRIRRGSLCLRVWALEARPEEISGQLASLADAFELARDRQPVPTSRGVSIQKAIKHRLERDSESLRTEAHHSEVQMPSLSPGPGLPFV